VSCTIRLYSVSHIGSHWKISVRRQIRNTDDAQTKHNLDKAKNAKCSKTKSTLVQLPVTNDTGRIWSFQFSLSEW